MKAPAPMTREELLELAALDAFGLLDEYEAALFTRSFHHAPAAVQDEIKELQAAFAADPAFLPEVDAPDTLRERVLDTVSRAVESDSGELAPLAMIGPPRGLRGRVAHRSSNGSTSHFWRAAALVLAAGNIVFVYFGIQLQRDYVGVTSTVIKGRTEEAIKAAIGGEYYEDYVLNPNCKQVLLTADAGQPMTAWVYIKEHENEQDELEYSLFVWTAELPRSSDFHLEARLDGQRVVRLPISTGASHISAARIDVGDVSGDVHASFARLDWRVVDADDRPVVSYSV